VHQQQRWYSHTELWRGAFPIMSWCRIWSKPGMLSSMESTGTSRDHYEGDAVFGVDVYYRHKSYSIEIVFSCYLCLQFCILHPSFASFWVKTVDILKGQNKRRHFQLCIYIKKRPGLSRVCPSCPGFGSTRRVDRVSPGQLLGRFLLRPGPVPGPGRPGPGSTRRAGPGFKTTV